MRTRLRVLWYKLTCRKWDRCINASFNMELFLPFPECNRQACPAYSCRIGAKAYQKTVEGVND